MKPINRFEAEDLELVEERCQPGVKLERAYVLNREVTCEVLPGTDGAELTCELDDKPLALKFL